MKRRELIKNLSVIPASGMIIGSSFPFNSGNGSPEVSTYLKRDLFKEFGLRTFINAVGTVTYMTGSLMPEEVIEAIASTSQEFVLLDEVQDKVGAKIADLCHAESATVTAGCWSAMILGTAAVLTGNDLKKIEQLPDINGMKSEVIVQKSHNHAYIHALLNTGVKIIEIENAQEIQSKLNEKTAMMWFLNYAGPNGKIKHEEWVSLGKKFNIPTMIDIAADVPPVENLWKFNDMGFDLVCISGGKALRGPQSAGILMGKKDLIAAARLNAPPRGNNIGRGMKVNKEEIFGMYIALERYLNTDHTKEWKLWEDHISLIEAAVIKINGVSTQGTVPPVANHTPNLIISWDPAKIKLTSNLLQERLRNGDPSIEVMGGNGNNIAVSVFLLKPGQEKILANRIHDELIKAKS